MLRQKERLGTSEQGVEWYEESCRGGADGNNYVGPLGHDEEAGPHQL